MEVPIVTNIIFNVKKDVISRIGLIIYSNNQYLDKDAFVRLISPYSKIARLSY